MEVTGKGAQGRFPFAKLNGLGNDFVIFDDRQCALDLSAEQVRWLCDRRRGIGADGVILVRPAAEEGCAGLMHYINADGTLAQMCGNGVRCFTKYLVDRGIVDPAPGMLMAETLAGPRPIRFVVDEAGKLVLATVDMGVPELEAVAVPVDVFQAEAVERAELEERAVRPRAGEGCRAATVLTLSEPSAGPLSFVCVSMGNPHAVCFIDDWDALPARLFRDGARSLEAFDVEAVGAFFEGHPAFPEKVNVEFAWVTDEGIAMRVFERGCGETSACGTGACAVLVAAAITGRSERENDVLLRGGALHILWDEADHVIMTGPAEESFVGEVVLQPEGAAAL